MNIALAWLTFVIMTGFVVNGYLVITAKEVLTAILALLQRMSDK